jgi:hypothetical protein
MSAKHVVVLVAILAVAVVGVGPAAAMFGQPDGVYAVTEASGGTFVNANIVVLLRPGGTVVIELRADGTYAGALATLGPAPSGVRLTGTELTVQGTPAGTFDLIINTEDSMVGTITRTTGGTTQIFTVSGRKIFNSDSGLDGVYSARRVRGDGTQASTGAEFVVLISDETRLTDAADQIALIYLASDGRYYTALNGHPLLDSAGEAVGAYFFLVSLDPLQLRGEIHIAAGVPSFAPGAYTVFGNRLL